MLFFFFSLYLFVFRFPFPFSFSLYLSYSPSVSFRSHPLGSGDCFLSSAWFPLGCFSRLCSFGWCCLVSSFFLTWGCLRSPPLGGAAFSSSSVGWCCCIFETPHLSHSCFHPRIVALQAEHGVTAQHLPSCLCRTLHQFFGKVIFLSSLAAVFDYGRLRFFEVH